MKHSIYQRSDHQGETSALTSLWTTTSTWFDVSRQFWQHVQAWAQPVVEWMTMQDPDPLFIQVQGNEHYQRYLDGRCHCKKQLHKLFQAIVTYYRQGKIVAPEQLRAALLSQQANFGPDSISPRYYDDCLKRLAKRLPRYAHVFEGVAEHFREHLKRQPELAIQYFHYELITSLIESTGQVSSKERLESQQQIFQYYHDLVPAALWQEVKTIITKAQSSTITLSPRQCRQLFKQLESLLWSPQELEVDLASGTLSEPSSSLAGMAETLADNWYNIQEHKSAALWGALGILVGASTVYQLAQENIQTMAPLRWLDTLDSPLVPLSSWMAQAYAGSLALHYGMGYAPRTMLSLPVFPVALTLATEWIVPVTAQEIAWVKTLGGSGNDYGQAVLQTMDGGYIVTGATTSFGTGYIDLWLSKWMADGTLSWVKTLGGSEGSYNSGIAVQQTSDGGYIVTGYTSSFGAGKADLWLSKWAADGTLTWVKTLGGSGNDYGEAIQQTMDGGYIVAGSTESFGAGYYDLWLSKWDANGTLSWIKTLGGSRYEFGQAIKQTTDGGYIVTGYTSSFGAGSFDLWLSKWAENGTLTWVKTLGGSGNDYNSNNIQQTMDGGYIVAGFTQSFGAGNSDLWLSKWAADGTLAWVKTLGGNGNDYGEAVQQTMDGGYIVAGFTQSFGAGKADLWLSKWGADGTLAWVKTLGRSGDDYGYAVQQTTDGGYIVTGYTNSSGAGNDDFWLSKWDSQGNIGIDCGISLLSINSMDAAINAMTAVAMQGVPTISAQNVTISANVASPSSSWSCSAPSSSLTPSNHVNPTGTASKSAFWQSDLAIALASSVGGVAVMAGLAGLGFWRYRQHQRQVNSDSVVLISPHSPMISATPEVTITFQPPFLLPDQNDSELNIINSEEPKLVNTDTASLLGNRYSLFHVSQQSNKQKSNVLQGWTLGKMLLSKLNNNS